MTINILCIYIYIYIFKLRSTPLSNLRLFLGKFDWAQNFGIWQQILGVRLNMSTILRLMLVRLVFFTFARSSS